MLHVYAPLQCCFQHSVQIGKFLTLSKGFLGPMRFNLIAASLVVALMPRAASAATVILDGQTALSIKNLSLQGTFFDVFWEVSSGSVFDGNRFVAQAAIDDALNQSGSILVGTSSGVRINNYSVVDVSGFVTSAKFATDEWQDATALGVSGLKAVINEVAPIPLPSSLLLLLTSIGGLCFVSRKL